MKSIFMWPAENDAGRELLEKWVRPLAARLQVQLETPRPDDDRRRLVGAIRRCQAVICDGSIEDGHMYHKMVELVKVNRHVVVCSRTALPRNVYSPFQCAPPHGALFSNEFLGAWLAKTIPFILDKEYSKVGYWERMWTTLEEDHSRIGDRIGLFVSYRGRLYEAARAKAAEVAAHLGVPFRVVPKGELVYETECLTRQQIWATVATIERELSWSRGLMLVNSRDYFDSFWTTSEWLISIFFRDRRERNGGVTCLIDEEELKLGNFPLPPRSVTTPVPSSEDWREYKRLLRQGDPGVVAPEVERGYQGLVGLFFRGLAFLDGHSKVPTGETWWSEVMVPCPHCGPKGRKAEEIDWPDHLRLEGYGYFAVPRTMLSGASRLPCRCPRCGDSLWLENRHPPRHMWIPGPLGRPWPESMEVLAAEPIWEVSADQGSNSAIFHKHLPGDEPRTGLNAEEDSAPIFRDGFESGETSA